MMKPPLDMKASDEEKNYGIDWAPQLADEAATIQTSAWVIISDLGSPDLAVATHDIDGQTTIVQVTGGEPDRDYTLQNTIVTSEGETLVDAIEIRVRSVEVKAGIY